MWHLIVCSDESWLNSHFSLHHSIIFFLNGWENLHYELGIERVNWIVSIQYIWDILIVSQIIRNWMFYYSGMQLLSAMLETMRGPLLKSRTHTWWEIIFRYDHCSSKLLRYRTITVGHSSVDCTSTNHWLLMFLTWAFPSNEDNCYLTIIAGEQKRACKTNLDWKGVTPFAL